MGEEQRNKNRFLVPKQHPPLAPVQCAPRPAFFSPFSRKITCFSPFFFFSFKIEGLGLCNPICTHSLVFLPACIPVRQISPNKPLCEALSVTACLRKKMMKKTSLPIIRANQQRNLTQGCFEIELLELLYVKITCSVCFEMKVPNLQGVNHIFSVLFVK